MIQQGEQTQSGQRGSTGGLETGRTVETVAAEIRALTASMLCNVIEIGRRMCEVKEMLPYGEFGKWIEGNTGYSNSTANNFMRLFQEYGTAQSSLFGEATVCQTFGKLSYSKALALLALPPEERKTFVEENHVEEMSSRELKKVIRERDEANRRANEAEQAAEGSALAVAELKEKLQLAENVVKLSREQQEKAEATLKAADAEIEALRERLEKQMAMADPVTAEFKGLFEQTSAMVLKLRQLVDAAPEGSREKLKKALHALAGQMEGI